MNVNIGALGQKLWAKNEKMPIVNLDPYATKNVCFLKNGPGWWVHIFRIFDTNLVHVGDAKTFSGILYLGLQNIEKLKKWPVLNGVNFAYKSIYLNVYNYEWNDHATSTSSIRRRSF